MIKPSKKIVICKDPENYNRDASGPVIETAYATDKNKPEIGIVVSFGEGKKPVEFLEGDTIIYQRYTDNRIPVGGVTYNFIHFKDIVGVISKEKNETDQV